MQKDIVYRITFLSNNQVYEIYARSVSESEMFGFVEVEELVFGETSKVLIDPQDEKIRAEFAGVKRCYLPLHNILRIDTLEKEGEAKVYDAPQESNIRILPTGIMVTKPTDTTKKD